jgi:hypothetical protein
LIDENAILSAELRTLRRELPAANVLRRAAKQPLGKPRQGDSTPGSSLP